MRIVVANTYVPLRPDDRDLLAARVAEALSALGHEAERVRIPFAEDPETVLEQILALRLTEVSDEGELMIAVGAHAHLLRHHRKVLWLDLWGAEYASWSEGEPRALDHRESRLRQAVLTADRVAISEARRVLAASPTAHERIQRVCSGTAHQVPELLEETSGTWSSVVEMLIS